MFTAKVDELLYSFNWYTIYMRIVDGGSPAPTFESFVFGHDNFKPSIAAKALIGGHCLLGADQT